MSQISSGSVLPGTELVSQSQIDEKRTLALNKKIEAIINAIMVTGDFVGFGKRMLARPSSPDIANKVVGYHLTESASVKAAESIVASSEGKETVSIFFNKQTKEYMVIKGDAASLRKGLAKEWELVPELTDLVAAQARVEAEVTKDIAQIRDNLESMQKSTVPEYTDEIALPGGKFWRRNEDAWCYFASPPKYCIKWVKVARRSGPSLELQSAFSGKKIEYKGGKAFIKEAELDGVRFDRIEKNVLGEVKGDYSVPIGLGSQDAANKLLDEAKRQVRLAKKYGMQLEWHVRQDQLVAFQNAVGSSYPIIKFVPY